jgi:hypothetical protein
VKLLHPPDVAVAGITTELAVAMAEAGILLVPLVSAFVLAKYAQSVVVRELFTLAFTETVKVGVTKLGAVPVKLAEVGDTLIVIDSPFVKLNATEA